MQAQKKEGRNKRMNGLIREEKRKNARHQEIERWTRMMLVIEMLASKKRGTDRLMVCGKMYLIESLRI